MAVIKVSDDLRKRLQGENSAAPAAPAATGTIKVSDELRLRLMGETATAKEGLGTASPSANAGTIKVSDQLKARLMGAATQQPAADPAAQERAAKFGIIEDPEDKLVEQLSEGVNKNYNAQKWGDFGAYTHKNPATAAKYAATEFVGGAADTLEGVGKAIKTVTAGEDNLTAEQKAERGILADNEDLLIPAEVQKEVDERIAAGDAKVAQWKQNLDTSRAKLREATGAPQVVSDIFSMAGQLALMGLTGAAGGGAAVRGLVGASTFGTSYEDATQMGAGNGDALLYASLNAIGQSMLEGVGGIGGRKGAETALQSIISEALEEGGGYTLETALQNEVLEANVPWEAKEAVYSAFLGALGGGAFAAGNVIGGRTVTPQMQQQAEQMAQDIEDVAAGVWAGEEKSTGSNNSAASFAQKCREIENGTLNRAENPFVFVADNTPPVLIEYAGAKDVPVVISYESLYLALRESGEVKGNYHKLGSAVMQQIAQKLGDPEYIIKLPNGRVNEVIAVDGLNGKRGYVSIELSKDRNGGTPGKYDAYNLIVTAFDAGDRYINGRISDPQNQLLYKKDASSQVGGGLYAYPSTIDEKASLSTTTIAGGGAAVNPQTAPSQYATNTMQQAAAAGTLPQDMADANAGAQHRVIGWEETTTDAQAEIEQRGVTGSANDLILKAGRGEAFTSRDVQKAQILLQQLSKSSVPSERDQAIELGTAIINASSDIGRALNIMRSMIRELPGGLLRVTERQVAAGGGVLSEQDIADITALEEIIRQLPEIQQMEGTALMARMGTLTADMSDAYRKDVSTVFSEDPANAEKWLLLLTQKKVSERTSASFKDKFTARQRINLLLNPKTQVRNIAGNLLSFGMESGSDVFAGAVDKALAKKTGQRTTGSGEFGAALSGAKAGAAEVNLARKLGVTNLLNNRYAEGQARPAQVFGENDLAAPMSNWLNDLTSYLLTMGDAVFSGAREAQVSAQLEGLGTDSRVAAGLAETAGREVTFQNDSKISKKLLAARKEVLGDGIISRIIMPFAKTPANILSRAISYSPAGLIEGAYAASKVIRGSDLSPEMQRKAATAIGRGLFGSMVTLAGAGLAAAGKASGAAPEDKDEAAFMKDVGGVLPNSIKIGNTWVDLSNIGPGMVALNLGATIYHELQREGVDGNLGAQITEALLNGIVMDVTGDSLWQGILDTVAYFEDGDVWGFMQNAAGDALSQMIPLQSFLRAITGSVDKYKRETSAKGGDFGWSVNYILSNIPGLSQKLPIKYDVTGEAVERYEGGTASDIFNAWLNPAAGMSKDKTDSELYQRVMELYEKEGSKSIFPTVSPYSVEYKGEKYALRGADRSEYQQTSGKDITAQLDELFASAAYKQATSEQQVEMMADLISNSTAEAKTGFLAKQGVAYEKSGVSSTIDKLAAYDVPASAVVLLAATDTSNDKDVRNSGAVKAAKAAIKLGLSTEAEYALIEHYGSKTIAESVKRARQYKVDPAAYLDTFQGLSGAENASQLKSVLRGSSVRGEALLSMLTESAEGRYGRFDGRWTVNGRSYAALTPETYVLCVCTLDGDLNKAGNIKKLMELGLSEAAAGDFYTVYESNSDRYN